MYEDMKIVQERLKGEMINNIFINFVTSSSQE